MTLRSKKSIFCHPDSLALAKKFGIQEIMTLKQFVMFSISKTSHKHIFLPLLA